MRSVSGILMRQNKVLRSSSAEQVKKIGILTEENRTLRAEIGRLRVLLGTTTERRA